MDNCIFCKIVRVSTHRSRLSQVGKCSCRPDTPLRMLRLS